MNRGVVLGLLSACGSLLFALSGFSTHPLTFARWYRRLRGGRWAKVSRGWMRVSPACLDRVDEDYSAPATSGAWLCEHCENNRRNHIAPLEAVTHPHDYVPRRLAPWRQSLPNRIVRPTLPPSRILKEGEEPGCYYAESPAEAGLIICGYGRRQHANGALGHEFQKRRRR